MAVFHKMAEKPLASEQETGRRRRYMRSQEHSPVSLTVIKRQIMGHLLDYRILLVPQTAVVMACSEQAARRHLRELFDAGLVERIAVPRAALADFGESNDASLTYGSAPAIHVLSKKGIQIMVDCGLAGPEALKRPAIDYGPQNSLFLRHELFVKDIRICLSMHRGDLSLRAWKDAVEAEIDIENLPKLRPDGAFVLDIGKRDGHLAVIAGFIEADRGTERGITRWKEKMLGYATLFHDNARVVEATGFRNARVLVVARTPSRRDWIWQTIEDIGAHIGAGTELLERFWIADKAALSDGGVYEKHWKIPGVTESQSLIS